MFKKVICYKGNALLIEDEDAPPTRYVKARSGRLFKHELEALKHKIELTSLDWFSMKRFYKHKDHCPGLEPNEKPPTNIVHHDIKCCYQTLNHTCFAQETPFNMVYHGQGSSLLSLITPSTLWCSHSTSYSLSLIMYTLSLKKWILILKLKLFLMSWLCCWSVWSTLMRLCSFGSGWVVEDKGSNCPSFGRSCSC